MPLMFNATNATNAPRRLCNTLQCQHYYWWLGCVLTLQITQLMQATLTVDGIHANQFVRNDVPFQVLQKQVGLYTDDAYAVYEAK